MADEDKQIEIKKRARRRLVGAAALALFAVIVLPMVMDNEPRRSAGDIEVRIPPQSGDNVLARSIEAPAPASQPAGKPAASAPQAQPKPVVEPAKVPQAAVARVQAAGRTPPPPKAKPAPVPAKKAAATSSKAPAEQKPPKAKAPIDDGARAAAILAGKSPGALVEKPRFVVQLGAYRDRSNAISLQNKLRSDGYSSFTEKAGDKTRVRIGPFAQRADAEAALSRLKRLGLRGTVLARD